MAMTQPKSGKAFRTTAVHLVWVILLAAACLLLFQDRSARIAIAKEENGFAVVLPDGGRERIRYEEISSLGLLPSGEWPGRTTEERKGKVCWGTMEDGTRYALTEDSPVAIDLQQGENRLLFSYENEEATRQLAEQIRSMMPDGHE